MKSTYAGWAGGVATAIFFAAAFEGHWDHGLAGDFFIVVLTAVLVGFAAHLAAGAVTQPHAGWRRLSALFVLTLSILGIALSLLTPQPFVSLYMALLYLSGVIITMFGGAALLRWVRRGFSAAP